MLNVLKYFILINFKTISLLIFSKLAHTFRILHEKGHKISEIKRVKECNATFNQSIGFFS